MKNILGYCFIICCLLLSGCTHVTPMVSSMNFSSDAMEVLGTGKGVSSRGYFLCVIPISDSLDTSYSVGEAIDVAVESKKGDALINTVADHETWAFPPFWCRQTIRVHGTVIKFTKTGGTPLNK